VALWYATVRLFAREGEGTLAPWDPTRKLVAHGPYRHVRNPMITGVLLVLLGEAALLGSLGVLAWAAFFFTINAIWFPLVEEPGLVRRFGADYEEYRRNVPRWVPRRTPWPEG
jgi:protein-S-isoprenylcysteine O-methyltransferase Ste14